MKQSGITLLIAFLLIGCENSNSNTPSRAAAEMVNINGHCGDLSGSWEMTYRTVTTHDSIYTQDETDIPTLKVLNGTHWMFVRQKNNGEFVLARGGPYKLVDGVYTEIVSYSSVPGNVGTVYTFECQLLDDSWYHKGQVGDEVVDEIWQRVEVADNAM